MLRKGKTETITTTHLATIPPNIDLVKFVVNLKLGREPNVVYRYVDRQDEPCDAPPEPILYLGQPESREGPERDLRVGSHSIAECIID